MKRSDFYPSKKYNDISMAKQFFRIPRPIPFDVPEFNQILKPKTNLSNYTPIFETNL